MLRLPIALVLALLTATGVNLFAPEADIRLPAILNGKSAQGTPTVIGTGPSGTSGTSTVTPTPTNTGEASENTATATPTPTNTQDGSANTPTNTPTSTLTNTPQQSPTSTPTRTPTATMTPVIQFQNNIYKYVDISGDLHVLGEIRNIGLNPVSSVEVEATLHDSQDNALAVDDSFAADRVLLPGDYACFHVTFDNPPPFGTIETVTFAETHSAGGIVWPGLLLSNIVSSNIIGGHQLTGNVENDSAGSMTDIVVSATIYSGPNKSGSVLRCRAVQLSPASLITGQTGSFMFASTELTTPQIGSWFIEAQSIGP